MYPRKDDLKKETMVYIHNEILISYKKRQKSCNLLLYGGSESEGDGRRTYISLICGL